MLLRVYWKEKRNRPTGSSRRSSGCRSAKAGSSSDAVWWISKLAYCVLGAEEEDMLYELDNERTDGHIYLLIKFFALPVGAEILKWDEGDESKVFLIHQGGQVYIMLKAEWTLNEGCE